MPLPQQQWTDFLLCSECNKEYTRDTLQPYSLACGHTLCTECYTKRKHSTCPHDQCPVPSQPLPVNQAIYQLIEDSPGGNVIDDVKHLFSERSFGKHYEICIQYIKALALYLKSIKKGIIAHESVLTRPMQRKIVNMIHCQASLPQGRVRLLRCIRAIGERCATELLLLHQNPTTLSASLWAAVRARGCQFLGPAMQEEALNLILLALEDGSELSRKVLVILVVQQLRSQFPQASKTSLGHVVQLLYRASCFHVTKRDGESSLMKLKEEFRTYEALRREHDSQIVQIAREAGLRIAADQWSALLYGDQDHKPYMQSIIDKLQSGVSFEQSIQDLSTALQRSNDPGNLHRLRQDFSRLAGLVFEGAKDVDWVLLISSLDSITKVIEGLVDFSKNHSQQLWQDQETVLQSAKYKTSFCRDVKNKGRCPRGSSCCFAHSQEELQHYRSKHKKAGLYQLTSKTKNQDQDEDFPDSLRSDDISPQLQKNVENFPVPQKSEAPHMNNMYYQYPPKCITPLPQPPPMPEVLQHQALLQQPRDYLMDPNIQMQAPKTLPMYVPGPAPVNPPQMLHPHHHRLHPPNINYEQLAANQNQQNTENVKSYLIGQGNMLQQQQHLIPQFTVTVSFASTPNQPQNQTFTTAMPMPMVEQPQILNNQMSAMQQQQQSAFQPPNMQNSNLPQPHQHPTNPAHPVYKQTAAAPPPVAVVYPQTKSPADPIPSTLVKPAGSLGSTRTLPTNSVFNSCVSTQCLSSSHEQLSIAAGGIKMKEPPPISNRHVLEQMLSSAHYKPPLEAAAIPSTSVLNRIELASVQQLRRRKDEILSKLIKKQSQGQDVQTGIDTSNLERFYTFWDSITNVNVVDNIVMMDNEDVTDALVNVTADMDTRTAPVMMRNTQDCGSKLSNLKPYKLNTEASKFDVKNAPDPLSALIYYSAGQELEGELEEGEFKSNDSDEIIPFSENATVSKYGPIARRIATKTINSELAQATAHTDTDPKPVKAETAEENLQFAHVSRNHQAEDLKNKDIQSYLGNEYAMCQLHASVVQTQLANVDSTSNKEPMQRHPPIPKATGAMTNSNMSPTQAASTIQLLQREENAIQMRYANQEVPEDLQLAIELQSIELSIHKKIQNNA